MKQQFFATCSQGLEPVLKKEIKTLNLSAETKHNGVSFSGNWEDCYRVNLHSRAAQRILFPLAIAKVETEKEVYSFARKVSWEKWFGVNKTIRVHANLNRSALKQSQFLALKVKDAIVDSFREKVGERPNIDKRQADIGIDLHVFDNKGTLSLDTSGRSLHMRGYRQAHMKAPLRETLAAGLILLSEWNGKTPFYDPMCGSGTLPIEAALIASNTAPGLLIPKFAFMNFYNFNEKVWKNIINEAKNIIQKPKSIIIGSDISNNAIESAKRAAIVAGVDNWIEWNQRSFQDSPLMEQPGTCICNPPYGQRIGDVKKLEMTYRELGDFFKNKLPNWNAHIFTGNLTLLKKVELRSSFRKILFNGSIECRLAQYKIIPKRTAHNKTTI